MFQRTCHNLLLLVAMLSVFFSGSKVCFAIDNQVRMESADVQHLTLEREGYQHSADTNDCSCPYLPKKSSCCTLDINGNSPVNVLVPERILVRDSDVASFFLPFFYNRAGFVQNDAFPSQHHCTVSLYTFSCALII